MTRTKRVAAILALAVLLSAVPGVAHAEKTVGISVAKFDFSVAAGQKVSGELYVINDGDEPMTVMVYAANQVIDGNGEVTYETPNRDDKGSLSSAATWVQLRLPAETKTIGNTPYLEMQPGDQVAVQFDVLVPTQAPPGDHQILLFFEMFDLEQVMSGTGSVIGGRIGSRVRVRVQGDLVEKIDISRLVVPGFAIGNFLDYNCVIANQGNIDKTVNATLEIVRGSGQQDLSSEVATDAIVYAGQVIERSARLDTSGMLGHRTVRLTVAYDAEGDAGVSTPQEVVEERSVWFIPWWLFIGAAALLGVLAIWLSWRQAAKSAARKAARRRAERLARRAAAQDDAADDADRPSPDPLH